MHDTYLNQVQPTENRFGMCNWMVELVISFTVNKPDNEKQVRTLLILGPEGVDKTSLVTATFCDARDLNVHGDVYVSLFDIRGADLPSYSFETSMRQLLLEVENCAPSTVFVEDTGILFGRET